MSNNGFTLIETLLAIALVAIVVVGISNALLLTDRILLRLDDTVSARSLTHECTAVARWLRDARGFAALDAGTYGLERTGASWELTAAPDSDGTLTRSLTIADETEFRKRLTCVVSWDEDGIPASVSSITILGK